jgi:1,4-dihydroxy-2-naphthoyl-CoA hydrolase
MMTEDQKAGRRADLGASILQSAEGAFAEALSIAIEELGPGRMVGRMVLGDQHLIQAGGLIHAGTVFGLADTCAGWGCVASLPDGMRGFTTIEANINLIATAGHGDTLLATAIIEHAGRTTQVWTVQVARQRRQRTIGLYRCTQMLLTSARS